MQLLLRIRISNISVDTLPNWGVAWDDGNVLAYDVAQNKKVHDAHLQGTANLAAAVNATSLNTTMYGEHSS